MTPRIPAVLLWTHDAPRPRIETYTAPAMCDSAEDAAAALRQGKPALVRAEDLPALLAELGLEQPCGGADVPTGTAQAAREG